MLKILIWFSESALYGCVDVWTRGSDGGGWGWNEVGGGGGGVNE